MTRRRWLAPLAVTAILASVMVGLAASSPAVPLTREGGIYRFQRGRWLYRFDASFRREALFDSEVDPRETRDLATVLPEQLDDLRKAFLRHVRRTRLDQVPRSDEEWRLGLESLGYVGGEADGAGDKAGDKDGDGEPEDR